MGAKQLEPIPAPMLPAEADTAALPLAGRDLTAKRLFDVVASALLLIVLAPLFAAVAVAIAIDSPGPVLYRCCRVGRHGREFAMLKFRKMVDGATGPPLTIAGDT